MCGRYSQAADIDQIAARFGLDPKTSLEQAERLLAPYPAAELESHPVSTLVNSTSHDAPDRLKPASRS